MNKTFRLLALLLLSGLCLAMPASAQNSKIATVDLKKLFDNYWKTKRATESLTDQGKGIMKERQDLAERGKKAEDEYKKLLESANDQAVSAEEREKRKKAAEQKILELRTIEQSLETFMRNANANFEEQTRRSKDNILKELREAITRRAKAQGFNLVLDVSGETVNGAPAVLYTSGDNDITENLLTELNATAPADAKAK